MRSQVRVLLPPPTPKPYCLVGFFFCRWCLQQPRRCILHRTPCVPCDHGHTARSASKCKHFRSADERVLLPPPTPKPYCLVGFFFCRWCLQQPRRCILHRTPCVPCDHGHTARSASKCKHFRSADERVLPIHHTLPIRTSGGLVFFFLGVFLLKISMILLF